MLNLCSEIVRMQAKSFTIQQKQRGHCFYIIHVISLHKIKPNSICLGYFTKKAKAFRQSKLLDIFLNHWTFRYFILVFCNRVYIRSNVNRIRCRPGCPGSSRNRRRWCIARWNRIHFSSLNSVWCLEAHGLRATVQYKIISREQDSTELSNQPQEERW